MDWHTSPRAKRLLMLQAIVQGTQYEGRPSWFNDDVPLFRRAPCIVYHIVSEAIRSFVDLVLGDQRFASFLFEPEEDVLEVAVADLVTRGVEQIQKAARFRTAARHALYNAMGTGSACLIGGVRNGKLFMEGADAWMCTPKLDPNGIVEHLTIEYPFLEEYQDEQGDWCVRAMLFRREITDQEDIFYKPIPIEKQKKAQGWKVDKVYAHNLGFCPVVWYAYMKATRVSYGVDGIAIHEGLEDEIYALDMALSQRHRAALYCGDPQIVVTGADPSYSPTEKPGGRGMIATKEGGDFGNEGPPRPHYEYRDYFSMKGNIKKSPGTVWIFPDPNTKVIMLTLSEKEIGAIDRNAQDLRSKLAETLSVVFIDPEQVKFASQITGKALETLRERQINRCDQIRDDIADGLMLPAVDMLLRIVATSPGLKVSKAIKDILPILKKFSVGMNTAAAPTVGQWTLPEPKLVWGSYFKEDPDEQRIITETIINAVLSNLLTKKAAIERLKAFYPIITNTDVFLQELEADQAKLLDHEEEKTERLAKAEAKGQPKPGPTGPSTAKKVQIK